MKYIKRENFKFLFSKDIDPTCECLIGESVKFETMDCFSNSLIEEGKVLGRDNPNETNPITGPLFIKGIKSHDSILIEIQDIKLGNVGIGLISKDSTAFSDWSSNMSIRRMTVNNSKILISDDVCIDIEPMIGTIGVAPSIENSISLLPGTHGGNMDCRFVKPGAFICLPVFIDGALLSMGDVHAAMGDGELGECGLEISSTTTIRVLKQDRIIESPYIVCEESVMVIASDENIYKAIDIATKSMVRMVIHYLNIIEEDACHLVNLKGNIGICQICGPVKTVRMELSYKNFAEQVLKNINV